MPNTFDAARRALIDRRHQLQATKTELDRQLKDITAAIVALDAAGALFDGTEVPAEPRTETLRLLATRTVPSQSYPWVNKYRVSAHYDPDTNRFVYRCSCPAFKFAKPDAFFGGEKTHCKHIRVELQRRGEVALATAARRQLARLRR